ncbi:MAG: hypothetical protein ACFFD4_21465 [Candidatus Odinarchaeota archaeon]
MNTASWKSKPCNGHFSFSLQWLCKNIKVFKSLSALDSRGDQSGTNYAIKRNKVDELANLIVLDGKGTLVYLHYCPADNSYRAWKINPVMKVSPFSQHWLVGASGALGSPRGKVLALL